MAIKVTLTLPDEIVAAVDDYVASVPGRTRSGICADAVRRWLAEQQEAQIARYYETMTDEERAEDSSWASLSGRRASRLWL